MAGFQFLNHARFPLDSILTVRDTVNAILTRLPHIPSAAGVASTIYKHLPHLPWADAQLRQSLWDGMHPSLGHEYICTPLLPTFVTYELVKFISIVTVILLLSFYFGHGPTWIMMRKRYASALPPPPLVVGADSNVPPADLDLYRRWVRRRDSDHAFLFNSAAGHVSTKDAKRAAREERLGLAEGRTTLASVCTYVVLWLSVVWMAGWSYYTGVRDKCVCIPCVQQDAGPLVWPLFNH